MGRLILGIALGIAAAFVTVFAIELAGHQIYPVPSDINLKDPETMGAFVRSMPTGALALVLIAWFAGAFDGGVVAALISKRAWTVWPVAALVAVGAIVTVLMIPHPALLQIGAVVAPLIGGFAAGLLARKILRDGS